MNPFTTNNARLLSDEQLVKTHEASLEILQEVLGLALVRDPVFLLVFFGFIALQSVCFS